jgi:hypothetical protein
LRIEPGCSLSCNLISKCITQNIYISKAVCCIVTS